MQSFRRVSMEPEVVRSDKIICGEFTSTRKREPGLDFVHNSPHLLVDKEWPGLAPIWNGLFRAKDAQRLRVLLNNLFNLHPPSAATTKRAQRNSFSGQSFRVEAGLHDWACYLSWGPLKHFQDSKTLTGRQPVEEFSLRNTYISGGTVTTLFS
jgi:hypothetical protein